MTDSRPRFSVVIPTFSRPGPLVECLRALATQDYPRDRFEVIVVDDGGDRPASAGAEPWRDWLDLTVLRQSNAGPARARNLGADRARGEYLAFTDDDCRPAPDWLARLADQFATAPDAMVGGRTINALTDNTYAEASQSLISYLYATYNADPARARFFASNNLAVPTADFRAMDGFDPSYPRAAGEDREFCERWRLSGRPMRFAPGAAVDHAHDLTFRKFWRQQYNYGTGAFRFRQMFARAENRPVRLEALGFYAKLPCHPFTEAPPHRALPISALLVLSQVANTAGYWREKLRGVPIAAARIPEPSHA